MESFQTFDAGPRNLVNKGRIQNGMDTNAVFIAWGQPTDAFTVDLPGGGQRMIWTYEEKWFYERKRYVITGHVYGHSTYALERSRMPIRYVAKSATFAQGKVVQWKKYDPPVLDQPPERPILPYAF